MFVLMLIAAAAVCAVVAWAYDILLLAYLAFALSAVSLLVLLVAAWKLRGPPAEMPEEGGREGDECDAADPFEAIRFSVPSEGLHPTRTAEPSDPAVRGRPRAAGETDIIACPDSHEIGECEVCVVPGRKRFHRPECRLLKGHEQETITVAEARDEGFTACSLCVRP